MKVFYRLWYIDFGGSYVFKDYKSKEEAVREAQEKKRFAIKWLGEDIYKTKLEKLTIETINLDH